MTRPGEIGHCGGVPDTRPTLAPEIEDHYRDGRPEDDRLRRGAGVLEHLRTQEIVRRWISADTPVSVLDVGGGTGVHAEWLASDGHDVRLVDPVPLHVEQARRRAETLDRPFAAALGDARSLDAADGSVDAVLLLGPLYHLVEPADRRRALDEAARVVRPGGVVFAAAISRFASLHDGLHRGMLAEPAFRAIVDEDLRTGVHENPTGDPRWFTTAYFHRPDELAGELTASGLTVEGVFGLEGPSGWLVRDGDDRLDLELHLAAARAVEREPSLLGVSAHLLAVGTVPDPPPRSGT